MENSPKVKDAIDKAFKYIDSLSAEELQKEMENAPDTGIGKVLAERFKCQDCEKLQSDNAILLEALERIAIFRTTDKYGHAINMEAIATEAIKKAKGE